MSRCTACGCSCSRCAHPRLGFVQRRACSPSVLQWSPKTLEDPSRGEWRRHGWLSRFCMRPAREIRPRGREEDICRFIGRTRGCGVQELASTTLEQFQPPRHRLRSALLPRRPVPHLQNRVKSAQLHAAAVACAGTVIARPRPALPRTEWILAALGRRRLIPTVEKHAEPLGGAGNRRVRPHGSLLGGHVGHLLPHPAVC